MYRENIDDIAILSNSSCLEEKKKKKSRDFTQRFRAEILQ